VWVFGRSDGLAGADLKKPIAAIFRAAGLDDARSQVLRMTFASLADQLGYSEATIDELIGHARRGVTRKHYLRRSDPVMIAAADKVAAAVAAALDGRTAPPAEIIELAARQ
jgi:integrase